MSEHRKRELFFRQNNMDRRYRKRFVIGPVTIGFVSLFFLAALSFFYLTQTNRIATKGYDRADLLGEKEQLLEEREELEVEAARLQSVSDIRRDTAKKMVKNNNAAYLKVSSSIAKK